MDAAIIGIVMGGFMLAVGFAGLVMSRGRGSGQPRSYPMIHKHYCPKAHRNGDSAEEDICCCL